jgi:hypothetical protein
MGAIDMSIRPDFARGFDEDKDNAARVVPRFSRGMESSAWTPEKDLEGTFATGQERVLHHPERELHGRFSRGQELG